MPAKMYGGYKDDRCSVVAIYNSLTNLFCTFIWSNWGRQAGSTLTNTEKRNTQRYFWLTDRYEHAPQSSMKEEIMKWAVRRKPTRPIEKHQAISQVIWQWYTIKEENWKPLPLKEFCNSIMQMKTSIDGCQKTGCLDLSGILNSFMSSEYQPFVSKKKKTSILDSGEKKCCMICVNRELTPSYTLETGRSGVKRLSFLSGAAVWCQDREERGDDEALRCSCHTESLNQQLN